MESQMTTAPVDQEPLNFKQWALYIFLSSLPLVGLILLLVWAFSADGNVHRKEWAKGMLLIAVIGLILTIIFFLIFGIGLFAILGSQRMH